MVVVVVMMLMMIRPTIPPVSLVPLSVRTAKYDPGYPTRKL